jgi:anti-sigma B factor antagonist
MPEAMIDLDVDDSFAEPGGLVVRAAREGNAFHVTLYGELDIASARVLRRRLGLARSSRVSRVVVDLSGLQFLDSAGLHALAEVREELERDGQELALLRGPRAVQQVFRLTGASELFQFDG